MGSLITCVVRNVGINERLQRVRRYDNAITCVRYDNKANEYNVLADDNVSVYDAPITLPERVTR